MKKDNLSIAFIQANLHWEDSERNLKQFSKKLESIRQADLIVLPEMFNTGFSPFNPATAQNMDGPAVEWLKENAHKKNSVICTTVLIKEDEKMYNRLFWVRPDGSFGTYDKKHLFRMGREDQYITAGTKKFVGELHGWKIMPLVCYDLRFPGWSRNAYIDGEFTYDLLIYTANWPEVRKNVWKSLLTARAIENQAFVLGVNRIGLDGQSFAHSGDSCIIDPKGYLYDAAGADSEAIVSCSISHSELTAFREKFRVSLDWDKIETL